MSYEDPFIVIDPVHQSWLDRGWTEEEFKWAVLELEKMPKEKLVEILKDEDIQISFTGENWEQETPKEEMASALIGDFKPKTVMRVLKKYLSE